MYPRCGKLNPDGLAALARADDYEQVKAVAEYYAEYSALFEGAGSNVGDKTLEDKFFEHEVCMILCVLYVIKSLIAYFFSVFLVYNLPLLQIQPANNFSLQLLFHIS